MTLAFKEWSYIVDALGKGMQSHILRKGGIAEEEGDFILKGNKFLLMPTLFHQAESLIKEEWLKKLDGNRFHSTSNEVNIEYYAEVALNQQITNLDQLQRLSDQHAWKEEVVMERYNRWNKSVTLLILQVFRLDKPVQIEMIPAYGGCKSWIHLEEDVEMIGKPIIYDRIKGTFF